MTPSWLGSRLLMMLAAAFAPPSAEVRVVPLPELGPTGDTGAEFLFSPNVGEAPLPLNRVASSGELARVMLALKR